MYDLQLTPEQLEIRDTVRDFVNQEIKPAALQPARLRAVRETAARRSARRRPREMGLRTLTLPEEAGGAGADCLTSCLVMEELGTGDPDIAVALAHTSYAGPARCSTLRRADQRKRLLPILRERRRNATSPSPRTIAESELGWCYHRPLVEGSGAPVTAVKQSNGDWVIDGTTGIRRRTRRSRNSCWFTRAPMRKRPAATASRLCSCRATTRGRADRRASREGDRNVGPLAARSRGAGDVQVLPRSGQHRARQGRAASAGAQSASRATRGDRSSPRSTSASGASRTKRRWTTRRYAARAAATSSSTRR